MFGCHAPTVSVHTQNSFVVYCSVDNFVQCSVLFRLDVCLHEVAACQLETTQTTSNLNLARVIHETIVLHILQVFGKSRVEVR